ncbi:MAG: hypothetical protein ACTSWL_04095 [Promethearchaeota archaeon]
MTDYSVKNEDNSDEKQIAEHWKNIRRCNTKPSPAELYLYYKDLAQKIENSQGDISQFHPVMALRTLITNIYNPIRTIKFFKILKIYFPQIYYNDEDLKKLFKDMSQKWTYTGVRLHWTAYYIIKTFILAHFPQEKENKMEPEYIMDLFDEIIETSVTDIEKKVFTRNDFRKLVSIDPRYPNPQALSPTDLPLFPIPGGDLNFFRIFENICKKTRLEMKLKDIMQAFLDNKFMGRTGGLDHFDNANFMPELLPQSFIELFMDSYFESLKKNLSKQNFKKFKNVEKIFRVFLQKFFLSNYEEINYYEFLHICKENHISIQHIEKNILTIHDFPVRSEGDMERYLSNGIPFSFTNNLYRKPFLHVNYPSGKQYKYNHIIFSWPILFDAYLANVAYFFRKSAVGRNRGNLLEDTIAHMVKETLFTRPFKILIYNQEMGLEERSIYNVFQQTQGFHYPRIEIPIDPKTLDLGNFHYREFDVCFIFNQELYLIETKDNLFVDTFDHPDLSLKWLIVNLRRLNSKKKILLHPEVKRQLEDELSISLSSNFSIQSIQTMFVSNVSFDIRTCFSVSEFKNFLLELRSRLHEDQSTNQILREIENKINQAKIINDIQRETKYLRRAFTLNTLCEQWKKAEQIGKRLWRLIKNSSYKQDKLIITLQLANVYSQLGNYLNALKMISDVPAKINPAAEPELAIVYNFLRGSWERQVGHKEIGLKLLKIAEKYCQKYRSNNPLLIYIYAEIIEVLGEDSPEMVPYLDKLQDLSLEDQELAKITTLDQFLSIKI